MSINENLKDEPVEGYRADRINGAMGALRLTNVEVAKRATEIRRQRDPKSRPVAARTVSVVRNGDPNVGLATLRAVAAALDLDMKDLFEPKEDVSGSTVSL